LIEQKLADGAPPRVSLQRAGMGKSALTSACKLFCLDLELERFVSGETLG